MMDALFDKRLRYESLDEYGKAKKEYVHAILLGIQCIEAYNDDIEESEKCVETLLKIVGMLGDAHEFRHRIEAVLKV